MSVHDECITLANRFWPYFVECLSRLLAEGICPNRIRMNTKTWMTLCIANGSSPDNTKKEIIGIPVETVYALLPDDTVFMDYVGPAQVFPTQRTL